MLVGFKLLDYWGYTYYDTIDWIKTTENQNLACSNGYMVYHAKETCLIGVKGDFKFNKNIKVQCFFDQRGKQSAKSKKIYDIIEYMVPDGKYIELFGRKNNLRSKWVTLGNDFE
jgi:mRNA (2'-O-methyladenosine-N6-)-methyltransferase